MAKIYYGLIFRELFLPLDQRQPEHGTILTKEQLRAFQMHHMLLQGARGVVRWNESDQHPASVFVYNCQIATDPKLNFDYFDMVQFPYLAIRVGSVAVIAVLQDWGALHDTVTVPQIVAAKSLQLHPLQFRQVAAIGAYMTYLFDRVPKHLLYGGDDHVMVLTLPLHGLSHKGLFKDFNPSEYAGVLAGAWDVPVRQIYDGANMCTLLTDNDGHPYHLEWIPDVEFIPSIHQKK